MIAPESIPIDTAVASNGQFSWKVLRLDMLHPVVSGNKPFKLSGYLNAAATYGHRGVVTFGGAWSNHIHAAAFATREMGLASIGIIRGARPATLSPTLMDAEQAGMALHFVSRSEYRTLRLLSKEEVEREFPGFTVVPEGGAGETGMLGASVIMDFIPTDAFDWIVCACGTGTTLAGLVSAGNDNQHFLGISVLKGHTGLADDINNILKCSSQNPRYEVIDRFHGGGYGKYNDELIDYMIAFHTRTGIPTDIIYTGKLMRAIEGLASEGFFPEHARVLAIHSGGLQGNRSLSPGRLPF